MKAARDLAVVGIGELLWDELPGGRALGGAPANFAVMASRLGAHGIIASRLGEGEPGTAARATLAALPADTRFLQTDTERPTGTVSVTFREGQPEYVIHAPAAWDSLELTPEWRQLAARADAVCWGTLAQRDRRSEETVHAFLAETPPQCLRIFDVNLRAPFYTAEGVERSLRQAALLKLNDAEMPHLLSLASLPDATAYAEGNAAERDAALTADARRLLAAYSGLALVAITLGPHGSLLATRETAIRHPGVATQVVDTVGAGDAFTAALCVYRLQGTSLAVQSEAANRWGSWVASQPGGMPALAQATLVAMDAGIRAAAAP